MILNNIARINNIKIDVSFALFASSILPSPFFIEI